MIVSTIFIFAAIAVDSISSATTGHKDGPPNKKIKSEKDCEISLKDVDKIMPLVLSENFDRIVYPSTEAGTSVPNKALSIEHGKKISIACPGLQLLNGGVSTNSKSMRIVCNDGGFDTQNTNKVKFTDLKCSGVPQTKVETYITNKVIGYEIDEAPSRFLPLIKLYRTPSGFYSYHKLLKSAAFSSSIARKSNFMVGTCKINKISADNYYERSSQQKEVNAILNLTETDHTYISAAPSSYYLARGHLSPVADFLYPSERDATNVCDNIAPQWQNINNGNWKTVESYVRDIAQSRGDLTVYTGTHQIASINGKQLFLAPIEQLPVPNYYWKIVHDTEYSTVAFVTLNNPHEGNITTERTLGLFQFCQGSCNLLRDLKHSRFEILEKGLTECCQVNPSLLATLGMPTIRSNGLLQK